MHGGFLHRAQQTEFPGGAVFPICLVIGGGRTVVIDTSNCHSSAIRATAEKPKSRLRIGALDKTWTKGGPAPAAAITIASPNGSTHAAGMVKTTDLPKDITSLGG